MVDSNKIKEFAKVLVEHSAQVQKGDNVYILSTSVESQPLFEEVRRQVIKKGAYPHEHFVYDSQIGAEGLDYDYAKHGSIEQMRHVSETKLEEIKAMDAYIRIGGEGNTKELTGIDSEKISKRKQAGEDILTERLSTKWVATRYPTNAMAQEAGMPTQEFEEFVFDAVTGIDWEKQHEKNLEIKEVFDNAEEVRIVSEGTDLRFSLESREGISSHGLRNMPDGEVFYAPEKNSVRGHITFSHPALSSGNEITGIRLEFDENGRIKAYSAEKNGEYLEKMIETDEGSHFIGEFGIGTNREIDQYIKNTLFDEKIGGTVHFAIGRAYEECVPEGEERNDSGVHWDIVKDLREKDDGGKIFVDGELVQENGQWVF
ncbi:MAG: aminopeptidase [Candidatus Nanohaloarchaea archaeon]